MKQSGYAAMIAILFACCLQAQAIDTITLKKDERTVQGRFEGYKNNRFYFQPISGKQLHEMRTGVVSLKLDPPSKVSIKARGTKKDEGYSLVGFDNGEFIFEQGGQDVRIKGMAVTFVKMELDFNRQDVMREVATVISKGEQVDIAANMEKDVATVVQFHKADVPSSIRQGTYVETLTRDSKGKLRYLKINLPSMDCPAAKQYSISSAPQFWFYGANGKLTAKLIDRFTEPDIQSAVKDAIRAREE